MVDIAIFLIVVYSSYFLSELCRADAGDAFEHAGEVLWMLES